MANESSSSRHACYLVYATMAMEKTLFRQVIKGDETICKCQTIFVIMGCWIL